MIFHSIYDTSFVFSNQGIGDIPANMSFCEMNVEGVKVQVSRTNNSELRIERVLSTNPKDYLNPKLQPGSIV